MARVQRRLFMFSLMLAKLSVQQTIYILVIWNAKMPMLAQSKLTISNEIGLE